MGDEDTTIKLDYDLENWMGNLPASLRNVPLIHLAIPGTHDSGTNAITTRSKVAPDAELFVKIAKGPAKHIVCRWAKTQNYTITDQLRHGIRYFDFRVAPKDDGSFHLVHGLYSVSVRESLLAMNTFLERHSREVIIVDCQHFYAMSNVDHSRLIELFIEMFGKKVFTKSSTMPVHLLSLENLIVHKVQVLVIYRKKVQSPFYISDCYINPWPNVTSRTKLLEILDFIVNMRQKKYGLVCQFLLTPTAGVVFKNLFGSLESYTKEKLFYDQFKWIMEQKPGPEGVNVIICDFIDQFDCLFVKTVINLNTKLL